MLQTAQENIVCGEGHMWKRHQWKLFNSLPRENATGSLIHREISVVLALLAYIWDLFGEGVYLFFFSLTSLCLPTGVMPLLADKWI